MKRLFGYALMVVLFAAPAFGGKKPQTVVVPEKVLVGSTQLAAGTYKLTYTGTGSEAQVTLTQDQKSVVTFQAKVVAGKNAPGLTTDSRNGATALVSIELSDASLELEGATQSGQ
jgi:hypothetical protein